MVAGVGAVFGLSARRTEEELKLGYDPGRDVYAGSRREAVSGRQSALIANILYGVAGAAASRRWCSPSWQHRSRTSRR